MDGTSTSERAVKVAFNLPDAITATEPAFAKAVTFCAAKMQLGGVATCDLLRQGDGAALGYFAYGLTKELAEYIGALDEEVQAVYLYDPEATPDDIAFGVTRLPIIHLLIWARRKTGALEALLSALDRAVTGRYTEMFGPNTPASILDAHVVNDAEVNAHSGFGALLTSLHNRPLMVWQR